VTEPEDEGKWVGLAAHVADGEAVDWTAATAAARTDADRKLLDRLQKLANIAHAHGAHTPRHDVHASITPAGTEGSAADPVQWGPLRILGKIGRGSFGDVYRARDPRLDRDVALKLLRHRSQSLVETEIVEEARLMARVRHPNVVTIYGADRIDGRTGIWMELLSPRTLADEVTERGRLPRDEAVRTTTELASALTAIHTAGLLHRDVKAQNVLRNDSGRAVLTDFGTGHEADDDGRASPIAGTPLYVAPEILRGEAPSIQSDIYSLGVLLFYLLSGRHPVEGRSLPEVRENHRTGRRASLASQRRFPRRLSAIVDRATHPDVAARPASAGEVESELAALLHPPSQRVRAAAALLLLLTAFGGYLVWHAMAPRREGVRALVRAGAVATAGMRLGGVSPDGSVVACSGRPIALGLCRLDGTAVEPVPVDPASGTPDGAFSQFSPDGRRLVYMRRTDTTRPQAPLTLHITNVDGSGDRLLFTPQGDQWFLRPGGWAARSNTIVADLKQLDGAHQLVLLDPETGSIRVVRSFDPTENVDSFDVSPDGRFIVHDAKPRGSWQRDLIVVDSVTGKSWTLAGGESDELAPAWAPDGSRVYFTSDRSGTMGIWTQRVVDAAPAGQPELIIDTGRDLYTPHGFVDSGRRLLYLRRSGGFDGYRATLDLSGGVMSAARLSNRALDQIAAPDWSPDGTRLAYLTSPSRLGNAPGMTRVVVQEVASKRELDWPIHGMVHQVSLRWWPDGTSVVLRRAGEQIGSSVVEQRDAETGAVIRVFPAEGAGGDVVPTPDGVALIYTARNAVRELRLADMHDRVLMTVDKPWSLSQASGLILTRDGDRLVVSITQSNPAVAAARILSRRTGTVADVRFPSDAFPAAWLDGERLMLAVTAKPDSDHRTRLFTFDPSTGATRPLGHTAEQPRQFRVHPDGRQILFSAGQSRLEFWWLENADRDGGTQR
jgi:Tol biopolymer transport system component